MPPDIHVEAAIEGGILNGRIMAGSAPGARFAFYVLRNEDCIHVRAYSDDPCLRLPVDDRPGIYEVIAQARLADEQPVTKSARRLLHAGPALDLKDIAGGSASMGGPLAVKVQCFDWPCLYFPRAGSRLFVLLSAAVDRKLYGIPVFNRRSWKTRFPGSMLCVSDPTLALSDTLGLGWYLGVEKHDATAELAQLVRAFARSLGLKNEGIVCYGSSGGGFAALSLAARLKGAVAVAINPQTDVTAYQHRAAVEEMAATCFPGCTPAEALRLYPERLSMLEACADPRTAPRIIYVQNRLDTHHFTEHFLPFARRLGLKAAGGYSDCGRHFSFVYEHENGHGPEPEFLLPDILGKVVEFTGDAAGAQPPQASIPPRDDSFELPQSPLFIVGTGRSGTTVLARLLSLHPEIYAIKSESQFLVAGGGLLDLFFETSEEPWKRAEAFIGDLCDRWFERTLRPGTPQEYKAGLCANVAKGRVLAAAAVVRQAAILGDISEETAAFWINMVLRELLGASLEPGHRYWLEKTPSSLIHMDRLLQVFPRAKFIHIVRDGRDVIASMLEKGIKPIAPHRRFPETRAWSGDLGFEKAAIYYRELIRIGRELKQRLPGEAYMELRLEDLSQHKERELARIAEFAGLDVTPEMAAFDLSRTNAGKARQCFSAEQIRHVETVAGDALRAYGYL